MFYNIDNLVDTAACIDYDSIAAHADAIYTCVVDTLRTSVNLYIPKQTTNFVKFWWSKKLDVLKDYVIASCKVWKESGRLRNGPTFIQHKLQEPKTIWPAQECIVKIIIC